MFKLIIIFILITVLGLLAGSHFETLTNYISEGLANFQKFITSNLTILELFKPMARTFSQHPIFTILGVTCVLIALFIVFGMATLFWTLFM
ncbi:hypothetical protein [Spiroplasma endosymbiont of 'Nebria riversi']|uniref:hypothetical protein n=1 Tax=Spiroplasma endosymbiont of 'Nebria riversi' TaxID=2792084 RepID=UPI001C03E457|nr:hypothetical protein [Spiroplasma endosymbiont of 'Nebria riversi']